MKPEDNARWEEQKEEQKVKRIQFEFLSPISEAEYSDVYIDALEQAVENTSVRNIAISAPYGAGKSSIIRTYCEKNQAKKHLTISLADFQGDRLEDSALFKGKEPPQSNTPPEGGDGPEDVGGGPGRKFKKQQELELEERILKHFLYVPAPGKIIGSRFRRLWKKSFAPLFLKVLFVVISVLVVWFAMNPERTVHRWQFASDYMKQHLGMSTWWLYVFVAIAVLGICIPITFLIKILLTKIKSMELHLFDKIRIEGFRVEEDGAFNRYIDEIVYFFEKTKYEIVFFEDLDRFDSVGIFAKLREINTLLNENESIKKRRKVTFIYALRDDLFRGQENRLKFFDFIIPVIPYISPTNARDRFTKYKTDHGLDLSEKFIVHVSPFIPDMRALIQSCNETLIMINTLNQMTPPFQLDDEKMMALMLYKNLYPEEYSMELEGKGLISAAFACRYKFIEKKTEDLKEQSEKAFKKMAEASMYYTDGEVVKKAFIQTVSQNEGHVEEICLVDNSVTHMYSDIMKDDYDLSDIYDSERIQVVFSNSSRYRSPVLLDTAKLKVGDKTYAELYEIANRNGAERYRILRKEYEDSLEEQSRISSMSLSELIRKNDVESVFSDEYERGKEIRENPLLLTLISNEYIDQNFTYYMNNYHTSMLEESDLMFVYNLRQHTGQLRMEQEIKNVPLMLETLLLSEFSQIEILNFSIFDYLMMEDRESERYDAVMNQLSSSSEGTSEFVRKYYFRDSNRDRFTALMLDLRDSFWYDLCGDVRFDQDNRWTLLHDCVLSGKVERTLRQDEYVRYRRSTDTIKGFLEENPRYFIKLANYTNDGIICDLMNQLGLVFGRLGLSGIVDFDARDKIAKSLFTNRRFVMNEAMILEYIKWDLPELEKEYRRAVYTTIEENAKPYICSYIEDKFDTFVRDIVLRSKENTEEDMQYILEIIRKTEYNEEVYKSLICKENAMLPDLADYLASISSIPEPEKRNLLHTFLVNDRVLPTWENVVLYYKNYRDDDDSLSGFVNRNIDSLTEKDYDFASSQGIRDVKSILGLDKISKNTINRFVKKYDSPYASYLDELSEDVVKSLINVKRLSLEQRISDVILTRFGDEVWLYYIKKNINNLIQIIDSFSIDASHVDLIFDSDEFGEGNKKKLSDVLPETMVTDKVRAFREKG